MAGACSHVVRTQAEVAKALGVGIAAVKEWVRDEMPGGRGRYDLFEIALWRIAKLKRRRSEPATNGKVPLDAKGRKDHFQAELARLKYETATGKLITSENHERELNAWCAWFVDALSQLPAVMAPRLSGKNVQQAKRVLRKHCTDLRRTAFGEVKG